MRNRLRTNGGRADYWGLADWSWEGGSRARCWVRANRAGSDWGEAGRVVRDVVDDRLEGWWSWARFLSSDSSEVVLDWFGADGVLCSHG